jgi:chromosome segregation ATPase
MMMITSPATN